MRKTFRTISAAAILLLAPVLFATDVTTYHNDIARTGQNLHETTLNLKNVNSSSFGKLFTMAVDAKIDAEPLYLSGVTVSGSTHNVLYAVTENDSAYAFDADTGAQLWKASLLESGESVPGDLNCNQITPQIGITSTPVIDRNTGPNGTIYVVAMSVDSSGNYHQRIHALDITTGAEEFSGPVEVQAQYPNKKGFTTFDAEHYAERAALLLLNGIVYTAWTSHCDHPPYTGWIIGFDASTLQATRILNVTANGQHGSIWMAGDGLASDGSNIFFLDANGTFDTTLNAKGFPINGDYGNAFIKVSTKSGELQVADYFNMYNTVKESNTDTDLGSGGVIVLPAMTDAKGNTRYLAVGAGKDTNVYIVDRDDMGKFNPSNNDALYQELKGVFPAGSFSTPAYFNGSLYYGPIRGNLRQYKFSNARLGATPASRSSATYPYPGSTPAISANQTANGIVWAIEHGSPTAILHAYNATNLQKELYNSGQAGKRDQIGVASHFGTPMIVNGKVYVGTDNNVTAFGLLGK
ncbi:MAG TPA: PQQ-binding-like beta-propeller repeat protein [Terriglobales bacterium]